MHRRRARSLRLAPEAPRAPATRSRGSRGPFEIQIGAFGDSAEAERRMAAARQRAGGMLDAYHGVAIPVQNGAASSIARASAASTQRPPTHLLAAAARMQIDCFVIKTE